MIMHIQVFSKPYHTPLTVSRCKNILLILIEMTYLTGRFGSNFAHKFILVDNAVFIPLQGRIHRQKHCFYVSDWNHIFNERFCPNSGYKFIVNDNAYSSIFKAIPHQVQGTGAKTFFFVWSEMTYITNRFGSNFSHKFILVDNAILV